MREATTRLTKYQVLGVSPTASKIQIYDAYRRLTTELQSAAESARAQLRFAEVTEAYGILSNAGRRAEYDRELCALQRHPEFSENVFEVFRDRTTSASTSSPRFKPDHVHAVPQTPTNDLVKVARTDIRRHLRHAGISVEEAVERLEDEGRDGEATDLLHEYANALTKKARKESKDHPMIAGYSVEEAATMLRALGRSYEANGLYNYFTRQLLRKARTQIQTYPTIASHSVNEAVEMLRQLGRDKAADALIQEHQMKLAAMQVS